MEKRKGTPFQPPPPDDSGLPVEEVPWQVKRSNDDSLNTVPSTPIVQPKVPDYTQAVEVKPKRVKKQPANKVFQIKLRRF